jgi:Family of unknown function (DUF5990)
MAVKVRVRGVTPPGPTCGPSPDQPDGYRNIHAALQHRQDYVFRTPGDQEFAADVDLGVRHGRFVGPYVHGRGDDRFLYLGWGEVVGTDFVMFRRAKIRLDHLDAAGIDGTTMEVEIDLSDERGHPTCASLRPPAARWRTADSERDQE